MLHLARLQSIESVQQKVPKTTTVKNLSTVSETVLNHWAAIVGEWT
jgi:hypothetical protein